MASGAESEESYRRKVGSARFAVLMLLAFSFVIFAVIAALAVLNEGAGRFFGTLGSINFFYYSLALACVLLSNIVGFPKWEMFTKKLGVKIKRRQNFAIYLSMFSMDITPGRWGRAVVSYTLNRLTGTRFAKTFPAVVADIFTDFLGFIAVALASSLLVHSFGEVSIVISILLLIPFFFIFERRPFEYVKKKLWRFRRLRGIFKHGEMYFRSSKSLDVVTYAYAMAFTIPSVILNGLALYFVVLSFGIPLGVEFIPTILFIYTSSLLLGMITGIPGTLGVTDAALLSYMSVFFSGFGITFGVASAITIFFRIASIWFIEGISALFLAYTFRYWKTDRR
jgi:glycosyltransferase 2 family protein